MAPLVAPGAPALLHRPQLREAPLAPLVHGYLRGLHPVDRHLLLPHGLDGKVGGHNLGPRKDTLSFWSLLHCIIHCALCVYRTVSTPLVEIGSIGYNPISNVFHNSVPLYVGKLVLLLLYILCC